MRNRYASALICILAGILYIAVPHVFLPVCEYAETAVEGHAVAPAGHTHGAHASFSEHGAEAAPSGHQAENAKHAEQSHMVCFWTAQAEAGMGVFIIFGGLLLALSNPTERRFGITLMLAASAVLGASIPTLLVGVCLPEATPCRAGTLPALLLLSGFVFLFSLLNSLYLAKHPQAAVHA
jgi:hypothetical protein